MDSAKGFFNRVTSGTAFGSHYDNNASNGMTESKSRFGMGIGNTPIGVKTYTNATSGYLGRWGQDRFTNVAICVRGAQLILVFCMLIVVIVIASFQNKWIGAISGLTGLLIIVTSFTFLFVLFLLGTSFAPSSLQPTVDRIDRIFEQPRLALVMNGTGFFIWLIISITQTASALSSKACKDPSADPHAKSSKGNNDDFVKHLPSFCSTKKAGAAFCWLIFLTCLITTMLFLRYWKLSRKNGPRIPPFIHPAEESDFEPIAQDQEEEEDYSRQNGRYNAPIMRQYDQGDDGHYATTQIQGYSEERVGYDPQSRIEEYTRSDPFADNSNNIPRQSYDYGAYRATPIPDPYTAIQTQLRTTAGPPQLPPLPPMYRGA